MPTAPHDDVPRCCGADPGEGRVTGLGLLTFAWPLVAVTTALLTVLFLPCLASEALRKLQRRLRIARGASLELMRNHRLFPRARSALAGWLFPRSARFSGFVYQQFNLAALTLAWALALTLAISLWALLH